MCQLLAMNALLPTDIVFSFEGFRLRGGLTDQHADGMGIAFFEKRGCRLLIDTAAASCSTVSDWVRQNPIRSNNIIAHIRKATQGGICLENTHPFNRELWGRQWVFAHNGQLEGLSNLPHKTHFHPIGDTDSELAFCHLMNELAQKFEQLPEPKALFDTLVPLVKSLAILGPLNFVLSFGDYLLVHSSTNLHYLHRSAPFKKSTLKDTNLSIDFAEVTVNEHRQQNQVILVATQPLTQHEPWQAFKHGELMLLKDGLIQYRTDTCASPMPKTAAQALSIS